MRKNLISHNIENVINPFILRLLFHNGSTCLPEQVHPTSIHICGEQVKYVSLTGRTNHGVATSWLRSLQADMSPAHTVPMFVRKSQFRLPYKSSNSIIMVGPGAGLAPFLGFIQERAWQLEEGRLTNLM